MTYQLNPHCPGVILTEGFMQTFIPEDPQSPLWQAYLAWLDAGNAPAVGPGNSIEDHRARKNAEINAARLAANSSSFSHDGHVFACDALSRGDIDGTTNTIMLTGSFPQPWPGFWKAIDNSFYPITTLEDWRAFYASMGAQGAANFAKSQQLKQALAAAATIEEIDAIKWED